MKPVSIWKSIISCLQQNIPVILLYVLESRGSSPGRQGFFMSVNAHHEMKGSIGGGIMEHKFVEMAKEKLKTAATELQVRKQIHDKSASRDQSGMICSGEQTILVYTIRQTDKEAIGKIITSLEQNRNGSLQFSPRGIEFTDLPPQQDFFLEIKNEEDWLYVEKTGYKNHLHIIGGGHCSLALSKLMSEMDFYIHCYDDRPDLEMLRENEFVQEKTFLSDYKELAGMIGSGDHHYVVVMTMGYRTDAMALRSLLDKRFRYLGLLGSKKKIGQLFDELRKEGIDETIINRIHSPVGIHIKSETPAEIAVSIAAQIISEKNRG